MKPFIAADILLPAPQTDMGLWPALACDQFTSEPAYWQRAAALCEGYPSALHITLPAGLVTTISSVGNMIGPLGMLLAGMAIASSPLKKLVLTPRYYLTVFLRLILYPMVTLGLLWLLKAQTWIPDGKAILMTVFLSGITPVCSALNSMVQLYDRDMEESGALYVLTTLLSIVTMPMVIAVFERVM